MRYYTLGLGYMGAENLTLALGFAKFYSKKLSYKVYVIGMKEFWKEGILID
jgi:hypothetical protein